MKPVFIYALSGPDGKIRYVGQTPTPDSRLSAHLRDTRNLNHKAYWIRKLLSFGAVPTMEILDVVPDNEADFWEREYIQNFRERGFRLTNFTDGGEVPPMRGKRHTAKARKKMSVSSSGKKKSLAHCLSISAGQFGCKRATNTSGFVGAYKHKASGKWQASFQIRKIQNYVGIFVKIEDAVFARALAIANQDLTTAPA